MKKPIKSLFALVLAVSLLAGCKAEPPVPQPDEPEAPVLAEVLPEQTPAPESAAEPSPVPTPEVIPEAATEPEPGEETTEAAAAAPTVSATDIPFHLAEFPFDWWHIDSSDDAYWNCVNGINNIRSEVGLPPLTADSTLSAVATSRCQEIITKDDFSHNGQCTTGEIIAENYNSAAAVCQGWKNSPGHYAQMTGNYTRMGIGCLFEEQGTVWCVVFE